LSRKEETDPKASLERESADLAALLKQELMEIGLVEGAL